MAPNFCSFQLNALWNTDSSSPSFIQLPVLISEMPSLPCTIFETYGPKAESRADRSSAAEEIDQNDDISFASATDLTFQKIHRPRKSGKYDVTFFTSTGSSPLASPPKSLDKHEGIYDIYMHKINGLSRGLKCQLWLRTVEGWVAVKEGHHYPLEISEDGKEPYVLALNLNDEPAWVKLSTLGRYMQKRIGN